MNNRVEHRPSPTAAVAAGRVEAAAGRAPVRRQIYCSENYSIESMEFGSTDAVFVSFSERTHPTRRSGESAFLKYRLNVVFVTSRGAHWYQYTDSPSAAIAVREYCAKYGRVINYGQSMGAYGALAFSQLIDPDLLLAYSPQFSLDPTKVPYETRWAVNRQEIIDGDGFVFDTMRLGSRGRNIVFFDPRDIDAKHVAAIRETGLIEEVLVPFSGHQSLRALAEMRLSSGVLLSATKGDLDLQALRRSIRSSRRASPTYLRRAAQLYHERSAPGAAELLRQATEVTAESRHTDVIANIRLARRIGDGELDAQNVMRLLCMPRFYVQSNALHVFHHSIRTLLRQRRVAEALDVLSRQASARGAGQDNAAAMHAQLTAEAGRTRKR